MKNLLRITVCAVCIMAFLVVLAPLPSLGNQPFHEDTNPPCLGASDPFCVSGDGGGGGSYCYKCVTTIPQTGPPKMECKTGSLGNTCTVTYKSNGDISCKTEGSC